MRSALISDVHGNLEALQAVLTDIASQKVDAVHCLGDVVGYGADPRACLRLVMQSCDVRIMGNHEAAVLGLESTDQYLDDARMASEWTRRQLDDDDLAELGKFELQRSLDDCFLVHASPYRPQQWRYVLGLTEAVLALESLSGPMGFNGHSHIPTIVSLDPAGRPRFKAGHDFEPNRDVKYLVNVGSVGQPRDNDPRACYVVFDHDEYVISYRRVSYNVDAAQRKMAAAKLPEFLINRLAAGV